MSYYHNIISLSRHEQVSLSLSWRRLLSYRNQSTDLLRKSADWFLYDNGLRHERVNDATCQKMLLPSSWNVNDYVAQSYSKYAGVDGSNRTVDLETKWWKDLWHCTKKWRFPLRISSVNVTKKSIMKNFIFCAVSNKRSLKDL